MLDTKVRVPVDVEVREDLHAMMQVFRNGQYSYDAPRTKEGHSDRCTALANASAVQSPASEVETGADPDYEAVAMEALAAARAKALQPAMDLLLSALETDDTAQLRATLAELQQTLPAIIEASGGDAETQSLMERILLGATQRGADAAKEPRK